MPAPSGAETQVGWGFETGPGEYSAIDEFFRVRSITGIHAKRPLERNDNIDSARQTVKGVNIKAEIMPKISFRPDVDSIVKLRAHDNRKEPTITDLTGAYSWAMTPWVRGDSEPTSDLDSLSMEVDTGDGRPVLLTGLELLAWNLKIAENKIQDLSFDFAGLRDTYAADVAEVAVNAAFTGRILVRGHRHDAATSSDAIKIKCIDAGGDGVATVSFTRGATAYGAETYTVNYGEWMTVYVADDSRAGVSRFEEFQVMFLDSAAEDSELTAADEWTIAAVRTAATATYSSRNVLHAAGVIVSIGGTEYPMHNVEVRGSVGKAPSFGTGSKYARAIQKSGRRSLSFTFDRDADDLAIFYKMLDSSSFAVLVDMYGDPIGASGYDERWLISAPNCQISDDVRDVTSENTLPEKITVEAFRSGATSMYTETIVCTKSAI